MVRSCLQMVRMDAIYNFTEFDTFGFTTTGLLVHEAGRSAQGVGRYSLIFRTIRNRNLYLAMFMSEVQWSVAKGPSEGPGRSEHM
jgi:hypothetical protein